MNKSIPANLYDRDYYKKFVAGYDSSQEDLQILPSLKVRFSNVDFKDKSVLDIGCGRGEFLLYSARRGARKVTGVDYSKAALEISEEGLKRFPESENIELFERDAKKLGFEDNSFDVVVMIDLVEHLHNWELKEALQEVARVLKRDGVILIHTTPNKLQMGLARKIAGIFGITFASDTFHVNEQSYFSVRKHTKRLFSGSVVFDKDKSYWFNQTENRGKAIKLFARIVDWALDNCLSHFIFSKFPFSILFGTDIWFIGRVRVCS